MITVEKGKSKKLGNGESLFITFNYDYDTVQQVKSISVRHYIAEDKAWEVPLSCIGEILEIFNPENIILDELIDVDYVAPEVEEVSKELVNHMFFDTQLMWIENNDLRKFTEKALELLPDYFFHVAASSTGKYHPDYALGEGGLERHTKAAMMIAKELFNCHTVQNFSQHEQDIILVALCLHDGVKHGTEGSKFTISTHPLEVVNYLENCAELDYFTGSQYWEIIKGCIASHMGTWDNKGQLPRPITEMEKFVHLCDYLSSRKCLEMNFNV